MFKRCFDDNHLNHAIGIALESFRLDIVKESIVKAKDLASKIQLLNYVLNMAMDVVENLDFRNKVGCHNNSHLALLFDDNILVSPFKVLRLLVTLYQSLDEPDYESVFQCLIHLNDSLSCAEMLINLVKRDEVRFF